MLHDKLTLVVGEVLFQIERFAVADVDGVAFGGLASLLALLEVELVGGGIGLRFGTSVR